MKIFISWSGQLSHAVAEHMSTWIKCVLQASQPWISSRDIDRGAMWYTAITEQLSHTSAGIVCLTQENKNKPWILFETGALAKGLSSNRVCTFLIDLKTSDLEDPLAQFNHTLPERKSMWGLVRTLNELLLEQRLDERILQTVFDTYWVQFELGLQAALEKFPPGEAIPPRSDSEILVEILNSTRSLSNRVRSLENPAPAPQGISRGIRGTGGGGGMSGTIPRAKAITLISKMLTTGIGEEKIVEEMFNLYRFSPELTKELVFEALVGSMDTPPGAATC